MDDNEFEHLLDQSSLGSRDVRRLRARTSPDEVARVRRRGATACPIGWGRLKEMPDGTYRRRLIQHDFQSQPILMVVDRSGSKTADRAKAVLAQLYRNVVNGVGDDHAILINQDRRNRGGPPKFHELSETQFWIRQRDRYSRHSSRNCGLLVSEDIEIGYDEDTARSSAFDDFLYWWVKEHHSFAVVQSQHPLTRPDLREITSVLYVIDREHGHLTHSDGRIEEVFFGQLSGLNSPVLL